MTDQGWRVDDGTYGEGNQMQEMWDVEEYNEQPWVYAVSDDDGVWERLFQVESWDAGRRIAEEHNDDGGFWFDLGAGPRRGDQ